MRARQTSTRTVRTTRPPRPSATSSDEVRTRPRSGGGAVKRSSVTQTIAGASAQLDGGRQRAKSSPPAVVETSRAPRPAASCAAPVQCGATRGGGASSRSSSAARTARTTGSARSHM
ncbi:MAG: hypothetical protein IT374_12420 [Polyangiaceae bacterium]|nr:hypothetical protein [Polyangiaceae bacterium]